MKTTQTLAGSMRRLLANLHPPSPPTARESQQLLNVLQSSFKSRLDEKHPAPSSHQFWPKSHDPNDIPIVTSSTSSHATNSHLSSILTSPVLGSLDGLRTSQDAISRFEKLAAEPEIDPSRLAGLVRWYSREVRAGRKPHHAESFSDRLNSWLHITSRASREAFLLNRQTRKAVIDLLHSEDQEAILWTWLRLVYERELIQAHVSSADWLEVEDDLISGIMRMSIKKNENADAAQQFLQACRYRLESGRGNPSKRPDESQSPLSYQPLILSGQRLASAIIFHRHQHGIDSNLFNDMFPYLPSLAISANLHSGFCAIYNPETPSAKHLYVNLKHGLADTLAKKLRNSDARTRKIVMISLLDASKLALDQGKRFQASFILNFAIERFPEYLPPRISEDFELERYLDLVPA